MPNTVQILHRTDTHTKAKQHSQKRAHRFLAISFCRLTFSSSNSRMFLTPISLQNSTNTSSSTWKTQPLVTLQSLHLLRTTIRARTRFMRSLSSVMSLSRDWMILLMSLIRGPKFASSLSSFDFS